MHSKFVLSAVLLACSPVIAATSTSTSASSFSTQQANDFHSMVESSGTHHSGSAQANAFADYGVLKVDGEALMSFFTGPNNFNSAFNSNATANSRFNDSIIFGGGPANSAGFVTFGLDVTGTQQAYSNGGLEAFTFGVANWELRVTVAGQTTSIYSNLTQRADGTRSAVSGGFAGTSPFDTHWFTAPMIFGVPLSVDVQLNIVSGAVINAGGQDGNAGGTVDLSQSAYWSGIAQVTLADSTPVSFTATAVSGTDYMQSMVPVPEPAAWILMLAGTFIIGWGARVGVLLPKPPAGSNFAS